MQLKELVNGSIAIQLINQAQDEAGQSYDAHLPVGNAHLDRLIDEQIELFACELIEEIRRIEPLAYPGH